MTRITKTQKNLIQKSQNIIFGGAVLPEPYTHHIFGFCNFLGTFLEAQWTNDYSSFRPGIDYTISYRFKVRLFLTGLCLTTIAHDPFSLENG
jgi:hypothetical protein